MPLDLTEDIRYSSLISDEGRSELGVYLQWVIESDLVDSEQDYVNFVIARADLEDGRHLFKVWETIYEGMGVDDKTRLQMMRFFINPSTKSFAIPETAGWFDFLPKIYDLMGQVPNPPIDRPIFQKVGFIYAIERERIAPSKHSSGTSRALGERTILEERHYPGGISFRGTFKDDLFDGSGVMTWLNGDEFTGEYDLGQAVHGLYIFSKTGPHAGHSYEGDMRDGVFHGHGVYTYSNGNQESGIFINGQFVAPSAEEVFDNGDSYVGGFNENHLFHYFGTYRYADGSVYTGDYQSGEMTRGKYTFGNSGPYAGHSYEGEILNGQFHGQGVYTFPDGTRNVGRFYLGMYQDE
jgi:hypothetical protein